MKNYKITIQYDGSRYSGWQKQGNTKNTIQGKIEDVLSKMTQEKTVQLLMQEFGADDVMREYFELKVAEWVGEAKSVRVSDLRAIKEYIQNDL